MTHAAVLALALGGFAGAGAAAQGVSGVGFTRGTAGQYLWIEINGKKLDNYLSMALPDTVVVTVNPRDSAHNPMPVTGFEVQVWDPTVLGAVGSVVEPTRAIARFVPRKRGQTTIQIRASGLRQWVRVELGQSALGIVPLRNAPGAPRGAKDPYSSPTAGGRVSYAAYEHTFHQQRTFDARNGFVVEGYFGRDFGYGVVLVGGLGFGLLQADSLTVAVTAHLLEAFFRLDYTILDGGRVSPVVSVGGGAYRIRTGGDGSGIWNTSLFWMLSAGLDVAASRAMTVEIRATTQLLEEINSGRLNGHVGNLLVIGAGVRFQF
ncbi:MAG: hypothetical protein ACREMW_11790 [Gemmatimonadales bacterium]